MASLHQRSGSTFHVSFRFQGQQFMRSLGTKDEKTARQKKAVIEQTIRHIDDGVISIDDDIRSEELWMIIKSGGKRTKPKVIRKSETLVNVFAQYRASFSANAKEATTVATERQHTPCVLIVLISSC